MSERGAGSPAWRAALAAAVAVGIALVQVPFGFGAEAGAGRGRAATTARGSEPPPGAGAGALVQPAAFGQPADEQLPVAVIIQRLDPLEIKQDSVISVVASLTNRGEADTGPVRVRLQRGTLISTRSELAAADKAPPPTQTAFGPTQPLDTTIAPDQTVQVTYRCTAAELNLRGLGVYPVSFEVRATADGATTAVGRVRTLLPYFPAGVTAKPTKVAWLWPLLDRPHRLPGADDAGPLFADEGLSRSVAHGGRLDLLLAVAEQVSSRVRLTLVIDPETIEALTAMTKGYRVRVGSRVVSGVGQQVAAGWLARLRRLAGHQVVAAVPYADPDVVALNRRGISDLGRLEQSDLDTLDRELQLSVAPSRLAWPPAGLLTDGALDDLVDQGIDAVVLDSSALPRGLTQQTPTPSAVSPLPALRGQTVALVTDPELERIVAGSVGFADGPRLAEQRYLAELAMITAQDPSDSRTYVITPPRRWVPSASYARGVLMATASVSWSSSLTVPDAVANTAAVDRGPLSYPASARRFELSAGQLQLIADVQDKVSDFRSALTNSDANALLSGYADALRWAASSAWRDNPQPGRSYAVSLSRSITRLRGLVSIVVPSTGIYTLTSSNSPLSLTVRNDLPTPVRIGLRVDTSASAGFHAQDLGGQDIPARSRTTLRVPVEVQRAGTFTIPVQLTTPQGGRLGNAVMLTVRSTAYGALALGITGVALIVLVAAVGVRLVRGLRAGNGEVPPPGSPADRKAL